MTIDKKLIEDAARHAYNAYKRAAGGKSLATGDRLPNYKLFSPQIKAAWEAAAMAVLMLAAERGTK